MVVLSGALLPGGCAKTPSAPTGSDKGTALTELRDWVRQPPVVPSEQDAPALRIACTAPNVTEICCALGLRDRIVARSRYCQYPPEILAVPEIGALGETNVEVLLAVRPDLVLVSGTSRATSAYLAELKLPFISVPDAGLQDIFAAIRQIGEHTGRPRTAAALCAGIEQELMAIAARYAGVPSGRVLILLEPLSDPPAPPFVAGPGSFHHDLLRRAGHRNAADAGVRVYGPLGLEAIVRADPDVIIELDATGRTVGSGLHDRLRCWSQVGSLRAVQNRRVHVLAGRQHHIPGPRVAQTFAELCRLIAEPADE
jgi:iron complex transport system substrate-binding protein